MSARHIGSRALSTLQLLFWFDPKGNAGKRNSVISGTAGFSVCLACPPRN